MFVQNINTIVQLIIFLNTYIILREMKVLTFASFKLFIVINYVKTNHLRSLIVLLYKYKISYLKDLIALKRIFFKMKLLFFNYT